MDRNPGSPYIDVEALSDEDSTQSQKLCTDQAEDQRVLTLAEQFLAAMPARIKNDQGEKTFCTFLAANIFESGPMPTPRKFLALPPLLPSCK